MSTAFLRTARALRADGFRGSLFALVLVAALVAAWVAWFVLARVSRYEVSEIARLEVDQAMHAVQSPLLGRVTSSYLVLGREVKAGEPLVELEADSERLRVGEEKARAASLGTQIESLHAEIAASREALARERQATQAAVEETGARLREAEALVRRAEGEAARLERLQAEGLAPARDSDQARLEAESRRAAAESLRVTAERLEREQRTREADRAARVERLQGEIRRMQGERVTLAAGIERLRYEVTRRVIRAPVAGRLGEVATLRGGAVVEEGQRLAAIVPAGALRAVAEFPPPAALGRIRPGQPARLRLEGFPWTQYGTVSATVTRVGNEIREGRVRVELALNSAPAAVPVQHGLPGSVEIEVERLSPAALVLRAAGRLLAAPRSPYR